jgi:hypothetical protein
MLRFYAAEQSPDAAYSLLNQDKLRRFRREGITA